jgi:TetR/AcrR family transcriptional regulator
MSPARGATPDSPDASSPKGGSETRSSRSPRKRKPQARALATRDQIITTAISAFSSFGFEGATTRLIAEQAGVNQGLITHHFQNKEELWKAAVNRLFANLQDDLVPRMEAWQDADRPTRVRMLIRYFVRYASQHPEQLRFMMQEGLNSGPRMQWLVENHLAVLYPGFQDMLRDARAENMLIEGEDVHIFYAFVGAASTIFALAAECEHLTGIDPTSEQSIDAHTRLIEAMLLRA